MKKQRKICILATAALLFSTVAIAGCNSGSDSESTPEASSINQEVTVTSIAIETSPRTEFKTTSTFSVDGGTIKATKSDGTTEIVPMTMDMIPSYPDLTVPGTKTVTVKYQKVTTTYDITVTEAEQMVPEITFTGDYAESGFTLYLEDEWNITFTVTEGVEYDWYYTANDGELNLGKTQPTEGGTYAINVVTVENEDYVSKSAFRWFYATSKQKQDPVITFAEEYNTSGFTVKLEDDWGNFGLTVTEGVEYEWWFSANDGETNLGHTQPTEAGTYAINVKTVATAIYNEITTFRWFNAVSGAKQDATITWTGDCETSGFTRYIGDEWTFSYTVTEGASYDWFYELNEVNIGKEQPTTAGTYVIKVVVEEDDTFNSAVSWRWFYVKEAKLDPTVTWTGDCEANGFTRYIGDEWTFTYTVTEGVDYDWFYTANDGEVNLGKTQPTTAGTYAINVVTVANDTYNSITAWRWFYVKEAKLDPTITWNGDCVESGFTRYLGSTWTFDYTVTEGVEYDWFYENNEVNIGKEQPTTAGTYVIKVVTTANDTYNSVFSWRWFWVKEAKQDATITWTGDCAESGFTRYIGDTWTFTYTVTEGVEYDWFYEKDEVNIGKTQPTTAGTYVIKVVTTANDTYNSTTAWRWFHVKEAKQDATVTWTGDCAENGFTRYIGDTWTFTYTVTEGVEYDWFYTANDGEVNLGKTQPTTAGTYAINVVTTANDTYNSVTSWRWFLVKEAKQDATITWTGDCAESGFTRYIGDTWTFTYTVTEGVEYDWFYEKDEVNIGKEQPTTAGTYVIKVVTTANDTYNSVTAWRWFLVKEAKQDPTITWSGDCAESGFTRYIGDEWTFDFTVTSGVEYDWYYEKDEVNIGKEQPTTAGTYVIKIVTTANDTYNSATAWRWFYVAEKVTKTTVNYMVVQFDGVDYEASGWGSAASRVYTAGSSMPSVNIVTNPTGYGEYVDTWITNADTDEAVEGWPTTVGNYVFCVNILGTNTHLEKGEGFNGPIYLPFSIVAAE